MAVLFSHALTSYLDNYDRKLYNALKRADGVISVFGAKGRIKEETGIHEVFNLPCLHLFKINAKFAV